MTRVLIACFSGLDAAKYSGRRAMCRKSWFPGLQALGYTPRFVFSLPESPDDVPGDFQESDCLILDRVPESYSHLPMKTHRVMQWAAVQDFDFLVKIDDDCLPIPSRLDAFLKSLPLTTHYTGFDVGTWQNIHHKTQHHPYASGACYILNRDAVKYLAESREFTLPQYQVGPEDVYVARILSRGGFHFTDDTRFCPWPTIGVPKKDNHIISTHAMDGPTWWRIWSECT